MGTVKLLIMDKQRRWLLIGIGTMFLLLSLFHRVTNATIAPFLIEEFNLSSDELGLLAAVFFWVFALFQAPLGFLLDRFGAKKTMSLLSLLGGAGSIIFSQSNGISDLLIGRALLGLGMSCALMGTLKIIADWFPADNFATLSGFVVSFATIGSMLATSPLMLTVNAIGWRSSFFLIGIINIALGVCFFSIAKDGPNQMKTSHHLTKKGLTTISLFSGIAKLLLNINFWTISWSAFFRYGTYAAIQALWAGPFLMKILNLPPLAAGNVMLLLNIGFAVGVPAAGYLSDKKLKSRKKIIIPGLILLCICQLVLSFSRTSNILWWGIIFFLIGLGSSCGQLMYSHIKELMPLDMVGRSVTGINFFTMMGSGLFLYAFGKVLTFLNSNSTTSAEQGYIIGFLMCFLSVCVAIGLYTVTKDSSAETINY